MTGGCRAFFFFPTLAACHFCPWAKDDKACYTNTAEAEKKHIDQQVDNLLQVTVLLYGSFHNFFPILCSLSIWYLKSFL